MSWDVGVVGAGPAGARAAELLARRGFDVLLFDPRAPWEKPCGGGLTAAALDHTPELSELADRAETIRELQVIAPDGASVVVPLRHPYVVVSREVLSAWALERAVTAGARFDSRAVTWIDRETEGWRLTDETGRVHLVRWLVGADSAASRVRAAVAPQFKPELAPTRVMYPRQGTVSGRAALLFLPRAKGYIWDFPRPGHHSVGIGVAGGTFARGALDDALKQYRVAETGEADDGEQRGAVIGTSAWLAGRFEDLGGDYALVGDAGGLADPATGEGIDFALRSGALAAATFAPDTGFAAYPAAARRALSREMRRARLIRRWLYRPAVANRLVRAARRSPRGALLLMALADAINEHGSLRGALARTIAGADADRLRAEDVCSCPDGAGASAPIQRGNATLAGSMPEI